MKVDRFDILLRIENIVMVLGFIDKSMRVFECFYECFCYYNNMNLFVIIISKLNIILWYNLFFLFEYGFMENLIIFNL